MNFGLSGKITAYILGVLEKHSAVEQALIFGSRAKGNFKTGSDIDLALSGKSLTTDDALRILSIRFILSKLPFAAFLLRGRFFYLGRKSCP